jgi:hypothetical protein
LQDAYHLSVFVGCCGVLRPVKRPVVQGDGTVPWIDSFFNGCTPSTCLVGCDKDMRMATLVATGAEMLAAVQGVALMSTAVE